METKAKIKAWLNAAYKSLNIVYVSDEKETELKDEFVRFFRKYDKRLIRINREKIRVTPIEDGCVRLTLEAWGKSYRKQYKVN